MSDQDLILDASKMPSGFWGEHIALGSRRSAEATINMLLFLLDRRDVGRRQTLRAGYGLRVVK